MKYWYLLFLFLLIRSAEAGALQDRYFISFTDKQNSTYNIGNPSAYLSQRAIDRRSKMGISVTRNDIPVNGIYLAAIQATGVKTICKSKWLNGVVVETNDSNAILQIRALPFVKEVFRIYKQGGNTQENNKLMPPAVEVKSPQNNTSLRTASFNYGLSYNQVHMINCDYLHDSGYDGSGKVIAILDAGFYRVDSLDAFDSIRTNNQILGTWDFVNNETDVYADATHGMEVLSCIAANLPGTLVGTAPHASFYLLESEDISSETIAEEYYWAAAAEYADSAGADIISCSLGYTTFDDSTQDHTYNDMNGHTTVAALAANHAASAGMLVIVSAGNNGAGSWNYISTPADADSALAIGAVDPTGVYASFSSNGPSSDGDIKPNVSAQGQDAYLYFPGGSVGPGNGTSFSAPIIAGAAACLWQAFDSLTNMQIFQAIERSANQYTTPDTLLGYGIPNFMTAFTLLHTNSITMPVQEGIVSLYPVPFQQKLNLVFNALSGSNGQVRIVDILGHEVYSEEVELTRGLQGIYFDTGPLSKGVYFLDILTEGKRFTKSMVKN